MRRDVFNVFYRTFGRAGFGYYVLVHGPQLTLRDIEAAQKDWDRYLTEVSN